MRTICRILFMLTLAIMLSVGISLKGCTTFSNCAPEYLNSNTTMYVSTSANIDWHANTQQTSFVPSLTAPIHFCSAPFMFTAIHKSLLHGLSADLLVILHSQIIPCDWYWKVLQTINQQNVRLNTVAISSYYPKEKPHLSAIIRP